MSVEENCILAGKNNTSITFLEYGGIPANIGYNILFFAVREPTLWSIINLNFASEVIIVMKLLLWFL